jgi:ribosomal protein L37AE/L43A
MPTPRHKSKLLRKRALDALLEMYNDPEYATHQHHAEPPSYRKPWGEKGWEPEQNRIPDAVIPPEDLHTSGVVEDEIESHEFFKESDPGFEQSPAGEVPVEEEIGEHEFFKEAPEYEMARGRVAYAVKKSPMREMLLKKPQEKSPNELLFDLAEAARGGEPPLECPRCKSRDIDQSVLLKPSVRCNACGRQWKPGATPKRSAAKPRCPECGSTEYSLMPSDFETAKCDKCGKNWDHGIVPGVNDPKEASGESHARVFHETLNFKTMPLKT